MLVKNVEIPQLMNYSQIGPTFFFFPSSYNCQSLLSLLSRSPESYGKFYPKMLGLLAFCAISWRKKCKKREELAESLPSSLFTRNYFLLLDTGPSCSAIFPLLWTVNNFQLVLTLFAHDKPNCFVSAGRNERNRRTGNLRLGLKQSSFLLGLCLWTLLLTFLFLTPLREWKYFYRVEHFGKYIHGNAGFDLVPAEVNDRVLVSLWEMATLCKGCPEKPLVSIW